MRLAATCLTLAVAVLIGNLASAQPVRVPGTRIILEPPEGFLPAKQYPGFESPQLQASIMVSELPTPAAAMRQGMTRSALASRGMTLVSSTAVTAGGVEGSLLHVRQAAPTGEAMLKWMLITGDRTMTAMITGTFPANAGPDLSEAIKRSILTARLDAANAPDAFEGLTFRVEPTRRLKIAGRITNVLMLTESGALSPGDPDVGVYIAGHSIAAARIEDLASFSASRARQTAQTSDIRNVTGRSTSLDGLPAYELQADATNVRSGRVVKLYQVIALDDSGYFIIQGLVSGRRWPELFPEFKQVTSSFRRSAR